MKYKKNILLLGVILTVAFTSSKYSYALDNIIRPYQSVRSAGMGGVRLTTGIYQENFFNNPARVTANEEWRIQLPDPMIETSSATITSASDIISSTSGSGASELITQIADKAGTNLHGRFQMTFPAVYIPFERFSFAAALITSAQFDIDLRRSYQIDPMVYTDIGPAVTIGRKFLDNKALSLGATAHITYRLSSTSIFTLSDLIQGLSLSPTQTGSDGAHFDLDFGATYKLPWRPFDASVVTALTINNFLGGKYENLGLSALKNDSTPRAQPRTIGLGISITKHVFWKFYDATLAFEITDIGNNTNGSLFRLLHLGGKLKFLFLEPRVGLNQGYFSAGVGMSLKLFDIDFATYGEEMTLNAGGLQDRRWALRVSFEI